MPSPIENQNKRVAADAAELFRAFLQFPAALALTDPQGHTLLVNQEMQTRFPGRTVAPESVAAAVEAGPLGGHVLLQASEPSKALSVAVRAFQMPQHVLLDFGLASQTVVDDELSRLRERVLQLERLAATDHLTGAWNRAHFDRLVDAEIARSLASHQPVSLVLLDIDHFKDVNDRFGHGVGDSVLRELVQLLHSRMRASDLLFRWGGEEFAVLATTHGRRGAQRLAQHLCDAVAAHEFSVAGHITLSAGVAEHAGHETPLAWFSRLDDALYAAKSSGRNRVVVDPLGNSDAWAGLPGGSALHLAWQEAYECGNPTIDEEHRLLFEVANKLIDAAGRAPGDPAQFNTLLDELLDHVRRHFSDEEAILLQHGYADLARHKLAHEGLLRRAAYLKAQTEAGATSLGTVVEFLAQDVIARHMFAVDRAFFPLFQNASAAVH